MATDVAPEVGASIGLTESNPEVLDAPNRESLVRNLLKGYDLRLQQMIERADETLLPEAKTVEANLLRLGVDPSWLSMDSVSSRLQELKQLESDRNQPAIAGYYNQLDLSSPRSADLDRDSANEQSSNLEHALTNHFRKGNQRLEAMGFSPDAPIERHLAFDRAALEGYEHMMDVSIHELLTQGNSNEDAIILVGERVLHDNKLYSVVHGVLSSSHIRREEGRVITPYRQIINQVENSPVRSTNGQPLSDYEMIGVIHTHPLEPDAHGNLSAQPNLSEQDAQALQALDNLAPGFIIGSVTPGALEAGGSRSQDIRFWDRPSVAAKPIASMRVM